METVLELGGKPVKMWIPAEEFWASGDLITQVQTLSQHPCLSSPVALMPDAHLGMGMPIGGVIGLARAVIPNAVGNDIGCGMLAAQLTCSDLGDDLEMLGRIRHDIKRAIPMGRHWHKERVHDLSTIPVHGGMIVEINRDKAWFQLGTLGGGNHFIEIQVDQYGNNWVMIHSGSRNVGMKVCTEYNKKAQVLNERYFSKVPRSWGLAFLTLDDDEGMEYLEEMDWCLEFAKLNRKAMLDAVMDCINVEVDADVVEEYDVHHNYAAWENHRGKNLLIHRKGATRARDGEVCVIPGNQSAGAHSFVGIGKGNADSFDSCSHGAGRTMGRRQAKRELDYDAELEKMDGVLCDFTHDGLDEAGGAYKDIDEVMARQADLVRPTVTLRGIAVVKA